MSDARREEEADRRLVTVVFADVAGFTTLAERLDPEQVRAFQAALFETFAQVIARYDGFVEKFVGDAVLAVFGAPVAHEDDPERALDAALDMTERCARLSDLWAKRLSQPISLHVGVHTGPVVAGAFASAAGAAYAVTGDTVNTTARLLAAATGIILASDATYALTKHRFAFEPARELSLRGKKESIKAHRLVGALAKPGSRRGLTAHGLTSPMVGRDEELAQLMTAFERMQRGRAQVVRLVAEAGAGKSRLIEEFLERLKADGRLAGAAVRNTACSSLGEPTYGVFGALFREAYRVERGDSLDDARRKLTAGLVELGAPPDMADAIAPLLSYIIGVEGEPLQSLEPEQLKRQISLAARMLLQRRLAHGPLVIIVEDLHWADAASMALLGDIADRLADRRLLLLLSSRPDARMPTTVRSEQSTIRLAPLSQGDMQALVQGIFGAMDERASARLQRLVAMRANGNPLFIEEIIRSLMIKGVLAREGNLWTCADARDAFDVPPTLQGLLLSRIDRLPADLRRLLQEAAVLGMTFDRNLLLNIVTNAATLDEALDGLVEQDLVEEGQRGSGRYRFTHALVNEVAYQNLLLSRRVELHERAGRALERVVGPRPARLSDLEALGHHWSLSSNKAKGADYLIAAGDWARSVYANEDAIRHYERAFRTLADCRGCDGQMREARERLADLLALTGRRFEALEHYDAVRAELEIAADRRGGARLHRKIGGLHWDAGDRESASASFARGLDQLVDGENPIERAQLFQEIGRLAFRGGDNNQAIAWAERALAQMECEEPAQSDSEFTREAAVTRAQAYNTLGVALARTGRLDEAVGRVKQSIELANAHDLLQAACRGYANLGVLYSALDPRRSIETCLTGLQAAKKVGDMSLQSRLYANLAASYCALTDRCEAEGVEAAKMAIDLDRRLELLDHLAVPLIVLGQIHQCRGERALAFNSYQEALSLAEKIGEPQLLFPCYDGLATLHLDAGDLALAEQYLAKSQEVCRQAGLEPDALMVLPFLC